MTLTHLSLTALAVSLTLGATAQTRTPIPEPQNQSIGAQTTRPTRDSRSVDFLLEALRSSLAEVRMGELAAQQSYDPRVRGYGTKLKADHTAHANEIERLLEPL